MKLLISRECVKERSPEPICQSLSVMWKAAEVVCDRGGVLWDGEPLTPVQTRTQQCHKAFWYLCGESGQSHNRKDPDSLQCGNVSSQEEEEETSGKRTKGEGESLVRAPSKAMDVGLPLPLSSLLKRQGNPLFDLSPCIEFCIMAHLVPFTHQALPHIYFCLL